MDGRHIVRTRLASGAIWSRGSIVRFFQRRFSLEDPRWPKVGCLWLGIMHIPCMSLYAALRVLLLP